MNNCSRVREETASTPSLDLCSFAAVFFRVAKPLRTISRREKIFTFLAGQLSCYVALLSRSNFHQRFIMLAVNSILVVDASESSRVTLCNGNEITTIFFARVLCYFARYTYNSATASSQTENQFDNPCCFTAILRKDVEQLIAMRQRRILLLVAAFFATFYCLLFCIDFDLHSTCFYQFQKCSRCCFGSFLAVWCHNIDFISR